MRNFLLVMLMFFMSFGFSSCVESQSISVDYQKVYFDRVIYGHMVGYDYVYDGVYSYHILGNVPENVYWELYPSGFDIYVYTRNMVRMNPFNYNRRYIFYNRGFHNYYNFDNRHRPPYNPRMREQRPVIRYNGVPNMSVPQNRGFNNGRVIQNRQPMMNNRPNFQQNRGTFTGRGRK